MENRSSGAARAVIAVLFSLIALASPAWIPGVLTWMHDLHLRSFGEIGPVLVTATIAVVYLLFVGAAWIHGKRFPVIAIVIPVLLPPIVGLTTAGYQLIKWQATAEHLTTLRGRIKFFTGVVAGVDAARIAGILVGGLLALTLGVLASFQGLGQPVAKPAENRALKVAALAASTSGVLAGLLWHSTRAEWPLNFDWLALGALASGVVAASALAIRGASHGSAHRLAAFAFAGSAYLFGLAEYALRRDRALEALPDLPFPSSQSYLINIAALPRPDAWSPRVDTALLLAVFFVPLLFANPSDGTERRAIRRGVAGGVLTFAATALALGAFDSRVARGLARQTAPLARFEHVREISAPTGAGDAIELGPALFVTQHGKVLYHAGQDEAPPAPLGEGVMPDKELLSLDHIPPQRKPSDDRMTDDTLLYADRRLSVPDLLNALAPIRDGRGVKVQLVMGPTASARDPTFKELADAFAGELGARTVVMTERFEDALGWLHREQRSSLTVLLERDAIRAFDGAKITSLPVGDSALDHERRQEHYRDLSSEFSTPAAILVIVGPDQRLEDITRLLVDFDTVLTPPRRYGRTLRLVPLVLTGDCHGLEATRR